ncbi:MAG: MBL fold metallo-hydrolase [Bacteroidetes bacterium]|nr:MAG: MBL fold metallo-hydrolase [Bacteroidota bacterium]REK05023.1 MAG: MBL fold metallo-hydrolase [Bacteroidota bacterium]REK36474.1 MAG: MBL fold metallo-hydrolase [Bacteroidota bacterium]REK51688.1 MAG: MBL fold metallo-hydrolase [Bacteroidota bacterium]
MIKVQSFTFNPFAENTFVLHDESKEAIIIDPGCYDESEKKELAAYIETMGLKPVKLINTHTHIDHILGNNFVSGKYKLELWMHKDDEQLLKAVSVYGQTWGINCEPSPDPSHFLNEGDVLHFGNSELKVLFTPGHSPGSISFYSVEDRFVIAGDVLFQGSIGRTDLPGGDYDQLIESIKTKLLTLGDDVIVYCGHGPETKIGNERRHNPFLTGAWSQ